MGTIFSKYVQTFENPLLARFEEGNPSDSLCAAISNLNPTCILPRAIGIVGFQESCRWVPTVKCCCQNTENRYSSR